MENPGLLSLRSREMSVHFYDDALNETKSDLPAWTDLGGEGQCASLQNSENYVIFILQSGGWREVA